LPTNTLNPDISSGVVARTEKPTGSMTAERAGAQPYCVVTLNMCFEEDPTAVGLFADAAVEKSGLSRFPHSS